MFTCYVGLVLIWTFGGVLVWSGDLRPWFSQTETQWRQLFLVHFIFLTWPAHEVTLYLTGKGLGSNALSQLSLLSLLAFFVWNCILWTPLLILRWRKIPIWLGTTVLVLLLLLTFALFWKFGNG